MIDYLKDKEKFKQRAIPQKKKFAASENFDTSRQKEIIDATETILTYNNTELDLQYKDLAGISMKKLSWGMWLVENKSNLLSIRNMIIGFIGVMSWLYFVYSFGLYTIKGIRDDNQSVANILQNIPLHAYFQSVAAANPSFSSIQIFNSQAGKYDFLVNAANPNQNFAVNIEYHFSSNGQSFGYGKDFLLPKQAKYIMSLGEDLNFFPQGVSLVLDKISWLRVNPHQYGNWENYFKEHLSDLTVSDINFSSANTGNELSEKIDMNNLSFQVTNKTPYNYYETFFIIILRGRGGVVGVNKYTLNNLSSETTQTINLTIPNSFNQVASIEVIPDVNILDKKNYKKFQ